MDAESSSRLALVTGAARGIGFAIAQRLAENGASVIITDIDEVAGEDAARRIGNNGGDVRFIAADVSNPDNVEAIAHHATASGRHIDILVNNAGIVSKGDIAEVDLGHWQRLFAIDVTSVFLLAKAVMPAMVSNKWGRIISIASVACQKGGGLLGNSCYAAAKGAVIAFNKGLAREAGPSGVICNVICPALTDTEMTALMPDDVRTRILSAMPLGHAGTPRDIAAAVGFLASREAAFITGVTLNVDGGFMRH